MLHGIAKAKTVPKDCSSDTVDDRDANPRKFSWGLIEQLRICSREQNSVAFESGVIQSTTDEVARTVRVAVIWTIVHERRATDARF